MKKMFFVFSILFTTTLFFGCEEDDGNKKSNAEIIDFNPDKCGCCWGWTIKMKYNTIKSNDGEKLGDLAGYDITSSIPVYIEIGDIKNNCTDFDYYEVIKIEKID